MNVGQKKRKTKMASIATSIATGEDIFTEF